MMPLKDAAFLAIVIVASAMWGWTLSVVFAERRKQAGHPHPYISSGRLSNLLLALIFGLLTGWFITATSGCSVDNDGLPLDPPEDRCLGLTLGECIARVSQPDGGQVDSLEAPQR